LVPSSRICNSKISKPKVSNGKVSKISDIKVSDSKIGDGRASDSKVSGKQQAIPECLYRISPYTGQAGRTQPKYMRVSESLDIAGYRAFLRNFRYNTVRNVP
jgi:hypothetical protein